MSILLESLNQKNRPDENEIPNLSDSHFDDEMLSDEWLLARVKFWKSMSLGLLFILIIALMTIYANWPKSTDDLISFDEILLEKHSSEHLLVKQETLKKNDLAENNSGIEIDTRTKKYQPKLVTPNKILTSVNPSLRTEQVIDKNISGSKKLELSASRFSLDKNNSTEIIVFESLSEIERDELPELEISSYAVSSNPSKSFVVLNGAFYAPGETIAPHLVLKSIDKEGIVVSYKNRMIRKKHLL